MATRSRAQRVAVGLEPGSRARCATSAKQMRSTRSASRRRPCAAVAQGVADAEAREERVEHVGAAAAARVDDLDASRPEPVLHGLGGLEDAADRGHEAPQRLAVDLVGAPEVVDDAGHRAARLGVALVVGELQVG